MRKILTTIFLLFSLITYAKINNFDSSSILGRWDITINISGHQVPSWLAITRSGTHHFIGEYVGVGGSARPISKINFSNGKMNFTIPPQWEKEDNDLLFEAILQGDSLSGTMIAANGNSYNWTAVRAPSLRRNALPIWGNPISLFNSKDLKGWHTAGQNQWIVEGGILRSPHSGSNLITDETFTDFKLHVEFRYPKESNSGVYLRGRYEVQIEDDNGSEPPKNEFGAVYGFISPSEMVAKKAGEWQSYDITLIGRMVTLVANGKLIICNQEIPGITGGAINSKEGEPGPIYFQGDHGAIDYRNIIITPVK